MKEPNRKDISPFDIFRKTLTASKRDMTPEEEKCYSPAFMNRILSMSPGYVMEANLANWLLGMGLDSKSHHMFLKSFLPNRKIPIDYIKKPKNDADAVRCIMEFYECGRRDAEEIVAGMDEKAVSKIVEEMNKAP